METLATGDLAEWDFEQKKFEKIKLKIQSNPFRQKDFKCFLYMERPPQFNLWSMGETRYIILSAGRQKNHFTSTVFRTPEFAVL